MQNDYLNELEEKNKKFLDYRQSLTKNDLESITSTDRKIFKIKTLFSSRIRKARKMIKQGNVGLVYTFSTSINEYYKDEVRRTLALFSPKKANMTNPDFYQNVLANLLAASKQKKQNFATKRLFAIINEDGSDPRYYKLPTELTNGEIVYLQKIMVNTVLCPDFKMGMNYVIYNRQISKDIVYLPKQINIDKINA
ncbi:MAG: hypothetical protein ACOX28_03495 [Bacilli bacterium]|jgi:hypothetical protein